MLVIVHDRYVKSFLQTLLNVETFRCFDVFEVDAAECRGNLLHGFAELLWVFLRHFDVEDVNAAVYLEQQSLALHYGFARHCPYVSEAKYGCSVRNHCHKVALVSVLVNFIWVLLNLKTRVCNAW